MRTTLNAEGLIDIPQQIRDADHLAPGDAFELKRLTPGHYLLAKLPPPNARFTVVTGDDGLPVIRVTNGVITSRLVEEIEGQTP